MERTGLVITVASQKGGAGKTTVATGLAAAWRAEGLKVIIVDADPQDTASSWAAKSPEGQGVDVVSVEQGRLLIRQVPKLAAEYDRVIIDTPPRLGAEQRGAVLVADAVVIPTCCGGFEGDALGPTLDYVETIVASHPGVPPRILLVLNKMSRTLLCDALRADVAETETTVLKTEIPQRVRIPEAQSAGQTVLDYDPKDPAAKTFVRLAQEVESHAFTISPENHDSETEADGHAA